MTQPDIDMESDLDNNPADMVVMVEAPMVFDDFSHLFPDNDGAVPLVPGDGLTPADAVLPEVGFGSAMLFAAIVPFALGALLTRIAHRPEGN